jgi:hypothetical protein
MQIKYRGRAIFPRGWFGGRPSLRSAAMNITMIGVEYGSLVSEPVE